MEAQDFRSNQQIEEFGVAVGSIAERLTENPCKKRLQTREQIERNRERWHKYYKKLTPEKKEERKQKQRLYYRGLCLKEEKVKRRYEHVREEIEWNRVPVHEYYEPSSPKENKGVREKELKHYKTGMTKKQIERNRQRMREYYRKLSPEKKEERKIKMRAYKNKVKTEEWIERNREKHRGYYRKRKGKEIRQKISEYYRNIVPDVKQHNLEHCEVNTKVPMNLEKNGIIQGFSRDMERQVFCYTCRIAFLDSSALLEHIAMHVTLPSVILCRIDKHIKALSAIKKESDNVQINSDVMQNVVHIKTERAECDDDIKPELNYTQVNVKTESEIEVDDVSFYTHVKQEIEQD